MSKLHTLCKLAFQNVRHKMKLWHFLQNSAENKLLGQCLQNWRKYARGLVYCVKLNNIGPKRNVMRAKITKLKMPQKWLLDMIKIGFHETNGTNSHFAADVIFFVFLLQHNSQ